MMAPRITPLKSFHDTTIQRYNDTTIQRYNDTTIQRYNDTTIQRYNDTTIQRYNDTTIQRYNDTTIQRYNDTTIQRYNDPRIKYIRQDNKGIWKLGETYNKALSLAKGDLIAILEGDDYWPHYKLKKQIEDFKNKKIVLSYGYTQITSSIEGPMGYIPPLTLPEEAKYNRPIGRGPVHMFNKDFLTYTYPVTVMIRRSALEDIGGFIQPPYLPFLDYPTFINLMLKGELAFHNEIMGFWRRHEQSSTKSMFSISMIRLHRFIKEFLNQHDFLPEKEKKEVLLYWGDYQALRWSFLGRTFLRKGEWEKARLSFEKGLAEDCNNHRKRMLKFGKLLSRLHIDSESVCRWLHIPTIDKLIGKHYDTIISEDMLTEDTQTQA